MRGTRVDTHDSHPLEVREGRYTIVRFGNFSTGESSKSLDNLSEKDAHNLYNQLGIALFPSDKEDIDA